MRVIENDLHVVYAAETYDRLVSQKVAIRRLTAERSVLGIAAGAHHDMMRWIA
jgi:hypothetical protein